MTSGEHKWKLRVAGPAARKISESLPEAVATAVIVFVTGALVAEPHRVGVPLRRELEGRHAARRGTFRIVYRIDESGHVVEVVDVGHRADIYRP